jgi:adenylate kinase family enzyme
MGNTINSHIHQIKVFLFHISGYILDGFPSLCEDHMTIKDQLELIKNFKLKPDFIINLKIPDADLESRRIGQRVDPVSGEMYIKEVYAPEKSPLMAEGLEEVEGEEEEEEEEEDVGEEVNIGRVTRSASLTFQKMIAEFFWAIPVSVVLSNYKYCSPWMGLVHHR